MLDQSKAAKFFVVAWCKDWTLMQYVGAVFERPFGNIKDWEAFVSEATNAIPWLPHEGRQYSYTVRSFVGSAYPKLSEWLWRQQDDVQRLKCAEQIPKLRTTGKLTLVKDEDRQEMRATSKNYRQAKFSYGASREAFKSNQRSAWNVCKA